MIMVKDIKGNSESELRTRPAESILELFPCLSNVNLFSKRFKISLGTQRIKMIEDFVVVVFGFDFNRIKTSQVGIIFIIIKELTHTNHFFVFVFVVIVTISEKR